MQANNRYSQKMKRISILYFHTILKLYSRKFSIIIIMNSVHLAAFAKYIKEKKYKRDIDTGIGGLIILQQPRSKGKVRAAGR